MLPKKQSIFFRWDKKKLLLALVLLLIVAFNIQSIASFFRKNKTDSTSEKQNTNIVGWGDNHFGEIGVDNVNKKKDGTFALDFPDMVQLDAGQHHTVALKKDGTVWTWGSNNYGQIGDGTDVRFRQYPTQLSALTAIKKIAAGRFHSLALKEDGTVWAWGINTNGQLGVEGDESNIPVQVPQLDNVKTIAVGDRFSLALKEDGTVWAWGGICKQKSKPEFQDFLDSLSTGGALEGTYFDPENADLTDQDLYADCLGLNYVHIESVTPVEIKGLPTIVSLDGGYGHILALDQQGGVWSWGCNKYGQVGNGTAVNGDRNMVPEKVANIPKMTKISAGHRHSLALDTTGHMWAWGHDVFGKQGTDIPSDSAVPIQVDGLEKVSDISAGHDYSLAIGPEKTIWGWGENHRRLLEHMTGTGTEIKLPIKLKNITGMSRVVAGGGHAFVIFD